jgi:hypothetical protein
LAFVFYHGGSGGLVFCGGMVAATLLTMHHISNVVYANRPSFLDAEDMTRPFNTLLIVVLFVVVCVGVAWLLRRTVLKKTVSGQVTGLLPILVAGFLTLIPVVVEIVRTASDERFRDPTPFWMMTPIGTIYGQFIDKMVYGYAIVAALVGLFCTAFFIHDYMHFHRLEKTDDKIEPPDDTLLDPTVAVDLTGPNDV